MSNLNIPIPIFRKREVVGPQMCPVCTQTHEELVRGICTCLDGASDRVVASTYDEGREFFGISGQVRQVELHCSLEEVDEQVYYVYYGALWGSTESDIIYFKIRTGFNAEISDGFHRVILNTVIFGTDAPRIAPEEQDLGEEVRALTVLLKTVVESSDQTEC